MAGRPSLGERRQVNVRLLTTLVERIDAARGSTSRDQWLSLAAELALKPTVQMTQPELHQAVHVHTPAKLLRTVWRNGIKHKVFECGDCGLEC